MSLGPAIDELLRLRDAPAIASGEVSIGGSDPFFKTPFKAGETTAASLAAIGIAANDIWEIRTGRRQKIGVAVRHAAATLRTGDYTVRRDEAGAYENIPIPAAQAHMLTVTQPWRTKDGRYFLPHLNLPNLAERVLGVLKCENTPQGVSGAVGRWNADDLEEAIAEARACGGKIRSPSEWRAHPQGGYLAGRPVIEITRTGDAPPEAFHAGERPLSGVRVLDLTRILAGPIAGRTLAEHGADVLMVTDENLPQTPEHVRDTSHGKRSCFLNLKREADAKQFAALMREADVVIDGYRPGRLAHLGFGIDSLMSLRPGIVYLSISCFGSGGPFAARAGWEQIAQAVTGVCHVQGERTGAGQPKLVFAPMCDYNTGYLAAYGVMLALARRSREGGSWKVNASLCQSAMFIQRQGLLQDFMNAPGQLSEAELAENYVCADTCYGTLKTLGPALRMSQTPPHWARPTPRLGSDKPEWLPRPI
ncbi:MAG TPA: CoA transferase [Micropepsaceae bacterium]|jgi:crotonobetainyl-CoA:carnitine CoA-transferase CaiB-like acyl-CoA transferase|nr:CoA transferase [Micropepsaceae bacterium]